MFAIADRLSLLSYMLLFATSSILGTSCHWFDCANTLDVSSVLVLALWDFGLISAHWRYLTLNVVILGIVP